VTFSPLLLLLSFSRIFSSFHHILSMRICIMYLQRVYIIYTHTRYICLLAANKIKVRTRRTPYKAYYIRNVKKKNRIIAIYIRYIYRYDPYCRVPYFIYRYVLYNIIFHYYIHSPFQVAVWLRMIQRYLHLDIVYYLLLQDPTL